ncbi:hypothetical protein [Nocardia farcinica]
MNSWLLAEAAQDRGSVFVDYIGLFVPLGVVLGAVIGAFANWSTDRKTPHDRIDVLIKAHKDWPQDLPGRDTIERELTLELARLRMISKDERQSFEPADLAADKRARTLSARYRLRRWFSLVLSMAAGGLTTYAVSLSTQNVVTASLLVATAAVIAVGWQVYQVLRNAGRHP